MKGKERADQVANRLYGKDWEHLSQPESKYRSLAVSLKEAEEEIEELKSDSSLINMTPEELRETIDEVLSKMCGFRFVEDLNKMQCQRCNKIIDSDLNHKMPMTIPEYTNEMTIIGLRHYLNDCKNEPLK